MLIVFPLRQKKGKFTDGRCGLAQTVKWKQSTNTDWIKDLYNNQDEDNRPNYAYVFTQISPHEQDEK